MSHLIEENIDRVFVPDQEVWRQTWHGLQTIAGERIALDGSNVQDCFCPIIECGVKPNLPRDENGHFPKIGPELEAEMKNWKLLVADCRNGLAKRFVPLHVPRDGYTVHQNKRLFDCQIAAAKQVLGENGFEIVTVGTLGGYSQFFTSIAIKGNDSFTVGENDTWNKFFNLNSSHNGLIGSNTMLSLVRIVCFNTVQASVSDAENSGTATAIKHTKNSESLITPERFAKDLQAWLNQADKFKAMLEIAKSTPMSVDQFKTFAAGVFTNPKSDELSTNSLNRIEEMTPLFQRGRGNAGVNRYDALNAFTEYFTSGNGVGNPDRVSKSKRLATANFGRANDWKLEAMRVIADEPLFLETCKRGEILYTDKLKVEVVSN